MGTNTLSPGESLSIIEPRTFVIATRESGYRDLSAALAELIDNSLQAEAHSIDIFVHESDVDGLRAIRVAVLDDGQGMARGALRRALQFGGTDRFDSRSGFGRFGMGLPNSSVSQARRLEVYSWQRPGRPWHTYLDIDEVAAGKMRCIPVPTLRAMPCWAQEHAGHAGTLVVWPRCDRLERFRVEGLVTRIRRKIGRLFRYHLWEGVSIRVNGAVIQPIDPLFLDRRGACRGARPYGVPLRYEVVTPKGPTTIEVRFSLLPVLRWSRWSSDLKRTNGVLGSAGVSIVRGKREVDYGWHLFGTKRRENYDDWWRCEIRFSPEADEFFGVTNSKQGVNPTADLRALLEPDLEEVARTLNRSVRASFNGAAARRPSKTVAFASRRDALLPRAPAMSQQSAGELRYVLRTAPSPDPEFYSMEMSRGVLRLTLNTNHPFFAKVYGTQTSRTPELRSVIESLVVAAARADLEASNSREQRYITRSRRAWSDALAVFLRP